MEIHSYRDLTVWKRAVGAELETQIEIAKKLPKMKELGYTKVDDLLEEVMKMLNAIISKLKS